MGLIGWARELKHAAYVAAKPTLRRLSNMTEPHVQAWHRAFPYRYKPEDFSVVPFVNSPLGEVRDTSEAVPRVIYVFWTGDNPMSEIRRSCLDSIRRQNADIDVRLVDSSNLGDYIVDGAPLHPAYHHLHFVHRSDYLRCYFMHFHGGGYADIKLFVRPWTQTFDRLDASSSWLAGYPNPVRWMTPNFTDRRLQQLMITTSERRIGQSAMIARPNTPFTRIWWERLNEVMDLHADELALHPGDARGSDPGYPVHWNGILAQIIDPLAVRFAEHILYDPDLIYDTDAEYL